MIKHCVYKFILEHNWVFQYEFVHYECISVRYPLARQAKGVHVSLLLHVYVEVEIHA